MVQVYMDDKSVQTIITPDGYVHLVGPGFANDSIPAYSLYHSTDTKSIIGTTEALAIETPILTHEVFSPNSNVPSFVGSDNKTIESTDFAVYYSDTSDLDSGGRPKLKPFKHVKFPRVLFENTPFGTSVFLNYWTNIPTSQVSDLEDAGKDATLFSVLDYVDEPFSKDGQVNTDLTRVLAYAKGNLIQVYDDRAKIGTPTDFNYRLLFERPMVMCIPAPFDSTEESEPVLDIHTGGSAIFLEFTPLT